MPYCGNCGAEIASGSVCETCAATAAAAERLTVWPSGIAAVQTLLQRPATTLAKLLETGTLRDGMLLLGACAALQVLGHALWWLLTKHAVFGLARQLVQVVHLLVYNGILAHMLVTTANKNGNQVGRGPVLAAIAATRVVPAVVSLVAEPLAMLIQPAASWLWGMGAVYGWYGLLAVVRALSPADEERTFRGLLGATAAAELASAVLLVLVAQRP